MPEIFQQESGAWANLESKLSANQKKWYVRLTKVTVDTESTAAVKISLYDSAHHDDTVERNLFTLYSKQ